VTRDGDVNAPCGALSSSRNHVYGWQVRAAAIDPGAHVDELALQRLVDRAQISDCLARYCRGVDRCDVDTLRSAYHPDATDDHGTFRGNGWDFAEHIVAAKLAGTRFSMHVVGNVLIDFLGVDRAWVETSFVAYQRANDDPRLQVFAGRYADDFARRDGEWRIAARTVVHDWSGMFDPEPVAMDLEAFASGGRGAEDPVAALALASGARGAPL
jgi:hypothetical protein